MPRSMSSRHHRRGTYAVDVEIQRPGHPETRQHTWQHVQASSPQEAQEEIRKLYRKHHREDEIVRIWGTVKKGD